MVLSQMTVRTDCLRVRRTVTDAVTRSKSRMHAHRPDCPPEMLTVSDCDVFCVPGVSVQACAASVPMDQQPEEAVTSWAPWRQRKANYL